MKMRVKRIVSLLFVVLMFAAIPGMSAFAAKSDVDFTINVPTDVEYSAGDTVNADVEIRTQTENGYVEMTMIMRYNADIFTYSSTIEDLDGFTVVNNADEGQLNIYYSSPDGNRSKIDTYALKIRFAVKTGVASGKYKLSLDVDPKDIYGFDNNGNKEPNILTVSQAREKELTVIETHDGATTTGGDGSDYPGYFTAPSVTQKPEEQEGSCVSFGSIIFFLIGALVVFSAGFFVGFSYAQRRMSEESAYGYGGFGDSSASVSPRKQTRAFSRSDRSAADDFDDEPEDTRSSAESIYDELDSARRERTAPRRPISFEDDDDGRVDTGYFGKAASSRLGDESREVPAFDDDDDDDDGFPDQFIPRSTRGVGSTTVPGEDRYGDFGGLLGARTRRTRTDDGYGSFTIDDDDPENGDYPSDRRRYR
ncbi:MAG: hypothetical protein E7559_00405 [Ruminococcaceae bacterium]|nr:hypothetical protein [Oscillospiraceae bacterium]